MTTIFKCPHCSAEYELIMTHISFRQRSYANCRVCWKNMYSWDSSRVPRFTLVVPQDQHPGRNLKPSTTRICNCGNLCSMVRHANQP